MRWLNPFLAVSAIVWLGLGLWGLVSPEALLRAAGLDRVPSSAVVELRAMYGGLPIAVGVLAAVGLLRSSFRRPALLSLAYASSGLFMARLLGAVLSLEFTDYTAIALFLELLSAGFAVRLLDLIRRSRAG